jgi:hypothetical protein
MSTKTKAKIQFEYTDTYGGDTNYSWVKRHTIEIEDNISDLALVRRAKKWAGINGVRAQVDNFGDEIHIRPRGYCTVLFISIVE